jgi:DNA-directed RNA polymerase specialized sigma24 family protein
MLAAAFPELAEDDRTGRVVAAALRCRLTPMQRHTLLRYAAGMTVTEIARARGVCPSTVSRTLARARRELLWAVRLGGVRIDD